MSLPLELARYSNHDVASVLRKFDAERAPAFDGADEPIAEAIVAAGLARAQYGERTYPDHGMSAQSYHSQGLTAKGRQLLDEITRG